MLCSHILYKCIFLLEIFNYLFIMVDGWMDDLFVCESGLFAFSQSRICLYSTDYGDLASSPSLHLYHLPRVHCFITEGRFE